MSYDVFMEIPKALRSRPKRGEYPPDALERLDQIVAALRRIDPQIELARDDALVEGRSGVLGDVVADPNRVSLRYTSAFGYHGMLQAMQRALGELEPLGFEGQDPQVGGRIRHFAERAPFLRQFRSQILCPDDEFEAWLEGREPAAWRHWRELKETAGTRYVPASFPPLPDMPDWQTLRDMDAEALDRLLKRLIAHNDRRIEELELSEFLQQARLRDGVSERRGNGDWLPVTDWFTPGTSLGQEHEVMRRLIDRRWPAVIFDQPQQVTIEVDANASDDSAACSARTEAMRSELWQAARALPGCGTLRGVWQDFVDRTEIECEAPDTMLAGLAPILERYRDLPIRIIRRYGWLGAREVESTRSD